MRCPSSAFAATLCFGLLGVQTATAQQYTITDLGTLGGGQSVGLDISRFGDVTGDALPPCCETYHAFLYRDGIMQDLGTLPGGNNSAGNGISQGKRNEVMVTGYSNFPPCVYPSIGCPRHAVLFKNGNVIDLAPEGGYSEGVAVNREGDVTGIANNHPFLYVDGQMQDLGTISGEVGDYGVGEGLTDGKSDDVQVTGYASSNEGTYHAFLYRNGNMQDLGALPGATSSAGYAINQAGEVTGYSGTPDGSSHAILYSHGVMQDLGTLPGKENSFGFGINRSGQVVGYAYSLANPDPHAFLYSGGVMHDLNDLIPSDSGWVLEIAKAINDRGQIAGTGIHGSEEHAFRLTPISAPKMDENENGSD